LAPAGRGAGALRPRDRRDPLAHGRALPGVAEGGLHPLDRAGRGDGALRRHRGPGRDHHHRHRVAAAPRLRGPGHQRRDEGGRGGRRCEVGEIYMRRAPGTAETYKYVGATAKTLPDGWESLGDLGWFDEDGYLYLADRRTDMILVGGSNVYPAEIEAALEQHPAVQSCAVIGLPDDDLGARIPAIVNARGEVPHQPLKTHLAS